MSKKKEEKVTKPEWDKQALREALSKVEGVNEEIVNHVVLNGVVNDAYVVQTFYRVTSVTAEAIIKAFEEAKK